MNEGLEYMSVTAGSNRFCPCVVGASKEALEEELGRAVRVESMNPTLKAPGTKRLKLLYDESAIKSCFQVQLAPLRMGWQLAQKEEWSQRLKEAEVGPSTSETVNMRMHPSHAKPSLIELNDSTLRGRRPSTYRNWGVQCETTGFWDPGRHLVSVHSRVIHPPTQPTVNQCDLPPIFLK
jgi:hypothetical protein